MRKNIRRIFSIILAAILLLCASLPVFAKSEKCSCGTPPVIYVAALGSAKLYLDKGTENERLLFRPDTAAYLRLAARLAPAIARLAIDKNYDAFGDALIDGVRGVFGDLQMNENGDSTDRVTSDAKLPDNPDHGVDKSYYFAYDFREDPLTVADKLLENLTDRVFEELMYPVFGSMPGIWSFVTDDEYEQAKKMTFNENTSKKLISRLDEYHYNVQCKAGEILNKAKKDGVKIMIVAGYNKQRTPLVESYMANSDATVDTKYASVGASVADLNSTLPDGYVQKNEAGVHDHLSKDGVIDASTCLLPENTWFIKDMLHCKIHDGHKEMYNLFFYSDSVTDVWSNEKYPQFLQNDVNAKTLTPIGTQARPAASNCGSGSSKEPLTPQTGSASFAAVIPLLFALPAGVISRRRKRS